MNKKSRILVVEDEEALAVGLHHALTREGYEVELVRDGAAAQQALRDSSHDLVLLDVMLPRKSGFEVLAQLRREGRSVPVVMLTSKNEEIDKVHGLDLGADDYMTKPFSMKELVARVSAHLRRRDKERGRAEQGPIEAAGLVIDADQVQAFAGGRSVGLTPREFAVLLALAKANGKPLARNKIYREAWGYEMMAGDRSVDVFVRKVRQKLRDAIPGTDFIITHYGVGYRFDPVEAGATEPG